MASATALNAVTPAAAGTAVTAKTTTLAQDAVTMREPSSGPARGDRTGRSGRNFERVEDPAARGASRAASVS